MKEKKNETILMTKGEITLISWLAIGFICETVKELMEMLDLEEIKKNKKEGGEIKNV